MLPTCAHFGRTRAFTTDSAPTLILKWRPRRQNTLRVFCRAQMPSGMIIDDIQIHQHGARVWANPPSSPRLDANGVVVRDERNKIRYDRSVSFFNHGTEASWSRQVVAALRAQHPDALDGEPSEAEHEAQVAMKWWKEQQP